MFSFGRKKNSKIITFTITAPVLFHKECNGKLEHGKLVAEHKTLGIGKNDGVRFCFDGIDPPQLTDEVMAYITDQAERKGFVVHSLHSYATVLTVHPRPASSVAQRLDDAPRAGGAPGNKATRSLRRSADASAAA